MQSIKTALPLPIPGFDNDQSTQLLTPIPAPPTIHCDFNAEHKDFSVSHTPSVEDVEMDSGYSVVFSSEIDPLEQLLSSHDHSVGLHRAESAYEALESQLNTSVHQDHESRTATTASFNQPSPHIQTRVNSGLLAATSLIKSHRIPQPFRYKIDEDIRYNELYLDGWDRFDDDIALASSLVNLVVECLNCQETWMTKAPIPLSVKILFGKQMERLIQVRSASVI